MKNKQPSDPNKFPDELYMDTKEASKLWNVGVDTVRKWCRNGKIVSVPKQDSRNRWRIPRSAQDPRKKK